MRTFVIFAVVIAVGAAVGLGLKQAKSNDGSGQEQAALKPTAQQTQAAFAGSPAPLAALHAESNALLGGGRDALKRRIAALRGHPVVVNVWASWCGPCRQEHPLLVELAKDPSIRVVGINQRDDPDNARRFLGALGNPYAAVGLDPKGRASIDWGVYGVPETFIVGPDGTIRHKHIGPLTAETMPAFKARLKQIPPA